MSLVSLPPELLDRIASGLEPADLSALRVACKDLCNKSFYTYAQRVLDQRWLLREESLSTLLDAAHDERFRDKLSHLQIGTHDLCGFIYDDPYICQEFDDPEAAWAAYLACTRKQDAFLHDNEGAAAIAMLKRVFNDLPALRGVEIGEWSHYGEELRVGWGGNALANVTQCDLDSAHFGEAPVGLTNEHVPQNHDPGREHTLTFLFSKTLEALSASQRPIEELTAHSFTDSDQELHGLRVDELQLLERDSPFYRGLGIALSNLKRLRLALDYEDLMDQDVVDHATITWLHQFVRLAPRLEHLTLIFDGIDNDARRAFDNSIPLEMLCTCNEMEHLYHFELANATVCPGDLKTFLLKHARTLKDVTLKRVALADSNSNPRPWANLFDVLRRMQLKSVKLACLYELHWTAEEEMVITFKQGRDACRECGSQWRHMGTMDIEVRCEHMSFRSEDGSLPEAFGMEPILRSDR